MQHCARPRYRCVCVCVHDRRDCGPHLVCSGWRSYARHRNAWQVLTLWGPRVNERPFGIAAGRLQTHHSFLILNAVTSVPIPVPVPLVCWYSEWRRRRVRIRICVASVRGRRGLAAAGWRKEHEDRAAINVYEARMRAPADCTVARRLRGTAQLYS